MTTKLPLRLVPQADLRKAWSEGRTFYGYDAKPPRGIEVPVEDMTLEQLIATQGMEPLSESRRSFLATGVGVHSLNAKTGPDSVVELLDYIVDDGPRCLFDAIDDGLDLEEATDRDQVDDRRFVPYDSPDFRTRDQIQWEQAVSQNGPDFRVRLMAAEDGRLTIKNIGRAVYAGFDFRHIASSAYQSFLAAVGGPTTNSLDELHARVDLIRDAMSDPVAGLYRDPDASEERERSSLSDDEIVHSSFETITEDGDVLIHHRSHHRSPWELWHHELPRNSSDPLELGFDLISNDEMESLLGVDAWDEEGMPLIA